MFEKELEQEEKTLAAERGRSPSDGRRALAAHFSLWVSAVWRS